MSAKRLQLVILSIITVFLISAVFMDTPIEAKSRKNQKISAGPTAAKEWVQGYENHLELRKNSIFRGMHWRFIGPLRMSGRVTDVEAPAGEPYTFYVGTASGGVWRTTNEGISWEPIFEHGLSTSIGDIAIAPSDNKILWVGTGEKNSSRSSYAGAGVYKSIDAGKAWKHMGLYDTHHISRIIVHPTNPQTVYAAAIGHLYSFNRERGVYKTTDGGKTWKKILFIDEKTGVIDLAMDPANPGVLYAASWERLRKAWNMQETGPGSAIYKTADSGKTWKKVTSGLPTEGEMGRIGLAVAPSNPNIVYALIDNHASAREVKPGEKDSYGLVAKKIIKGAEVYRSDDKGESWKRVNKDEIWDLYLEYGYYFGEVRVDPKDENTIYILGVPLYKSADGGVTYKELDYKAFHGDHQAMWIDPVNPRRIISGNDGGINISYDGGLSWRDIDNLPVVQFYNVYVDMQTPFNVYGSVQDNGCFKAPVTHNPATDPKHEWKSIMGGEASYIEVDPTDPDILISEGYYGTLFKTDYKTNKRKIIKPKVKKGDPPMRTNWLTPFIISPHNPYTIYYGSQYIHRSVDMGENWQRISPDLTTNPVKKESDVPYGTITTISESPLVPGIVYAGTDDGNIQVTRNGGTAWKKITGGLPAKKWVSRVVASKYDKATVYAVLNGYRDDDFRVYVYKSVNYGTTWQNIGGNLPCGPVNVIREDPRGPGILYTGTDLGVYVSFDGGKQWNSLQADMPDTFVHDLVIHPRDNILVAATHGRGMFTLDVSPIQKYSTIQTEALHVFPISPVTLPRSYWDSRKPASFVFYLKKASEIDVSILDASNKTVRTFKTKAQTGFNHLQWDLKLDPKNKKSPRYAKAGTYTIQLTLPSGTGKKQKIQLK